MNQPERLTKPSVSHKRRALQAFLSVAVAGGMLLGTSAADACDYCDSVGCDSVGCDTVGCDSGACDSGACDSGACRPAGRRLSIPAPGKAIFKTLDAVAGGIEKVLGFDKCSSGLSCDSNCDDGCDAALMNDLMTSHQPTYVPHAPTPHTFPIPPAPAPLAPAPVVTAPPVVAAPPVYAAPPAPIMAQPRARMTEPMIVSPQSQPYQAIPSTTPREPYPQLESLPGQSDMAPIQDAPIDRLPSGDAMPNTTPRTTTPRTTTPRTTTPRTTTPRKTAPGIPVPDTNTNPPEQPKGGLFDNLDPFGDDSEVRLPKPYRSVKPSNFRLPKSQTSRSGVQLQAPQASSSRTLRHQSAAQQRSVAMMRHGNSTHASSRQVAQPHQHATHRYTANQHTTASQHKGYHSGNAKTVARHTSTRSSGTQRAATYHARQVSHQQSAQHKAAAQRAAAQRSSAHNHTSLQRQATQAKLKPVPQPRAINGQRHSVPNYSAYGHTTNR